MVSTASTAAMDLAEVVPAFLSGIAQELGVEPSEFKRVLAGDTHPDFDGNPVTSLSGSLHKNLIWRSGLRVTCLSWLLTAHPRIPLRATSKGPTSLPMTTSQSLCTRLGYRFMLECYQIQDDLRNARRLRQQGSHYVCCEILSILM